MDRLERQVLSDRQTAAILAAAGATDVEIPELHVQRALFDAALNEEPAPLAQMDRNQLELRRALGVA